MFLFMHLIIMIHSFNHRHRLHVLSHVDYAALWTECTQYLRHLSTHLVPQKNVKFYQQQALLELLLLDQRTERLLKKLAKWKSPLMSDSSTTADFKEQYSSLTQSLHFRFKRIPVFLLSLERFFVLSLYFYFFSSNIKSGTYYHYYLLAALFSTFFGFFLVNFSVLLCLAEISPKRTAFFSIFF